MNTRTMVLAGLVVVLGAGAAAWYFELLDDVPLPWADPKPVAVKPAPAPAAKAPEAPKPAPQAAAPAPNPSDPEAMDRAIKASQARAGELEKTVADLQKQVEAKNQAISEAEKKAAAK